VLSFSATLRDDNTFRVFENRVPKRELEFKSEEVTGSWRKFNNEEFHNLSLFPSIQEAI
jgi:hypothetical protein